MYSLFIQPNWTPQRQALEKTIHCLEHTRRVIDVLSALTHEGRTHTHTRTHVCYFDHLCFICENVTMRIRRALIIDVFFTPGGNLMIEAHEGKSIRIIIFPMMRFGAVRTHICSVCHRGQPVSCHTGVSNLCCCCRRRCDTAEDGTPPR